MGSLEERYTTTSHLLACVYFNTQEYEVCYQTLQSLESNTQGFPSNIKIQIKLLLAKCALYLGLSEKSYNYSLDALNDAKLELGEQNKNTAEAFFVTGLICKSVNKDNEALVF